MIYSVSFLHESETKKTKLKHKKLYKTTWNFFHILLFCYRQIIYETRTNREKDSEQKSWSDFHGTFKGVTQSSGAEGETGSKLPVTGGRTRPDRPTRLRWTDGREERDRNERTASRQTDGRSVKQTDGRTAAWTEPTGGKRRRDWKRQADRTDPRFSPEPENKFVHLGDVSEAAGSPAGQLLF